MPVTHITKNIPGFAVATGASAGTLFGPILINYMDEVSFHIQNCATFPIQFRIIASSDYGQLYSNDIPTPQLQNGDLGVDGNSVHVNGIKGINSYKFLTILASATASVTSGVARMVITAKRRV